MITNDAIMVAKVTKLATNLVAKMMPTWLYRQDFVKFSLNHHYNNRYYYKKLQLLPKPEKNVKDLDMHEKPDE
ncbi:hypothetical protein TNCV_1447241 [Trichonephila clavipes]|nr:hypothetical protein TNCV_1447241 [Trichonephila clavipes]